MEPMTDRQFSMDGSAPNTVEILVVTSLAVTGRVIRAKG
jgi:hypothetical protein